MRGHGRIALILAIIGVIVILAYKFVMPVFESQSQLSSSDGKSIRAKLIIGMDSWIGYFPLCSREMVQAMRADNVLLQCVDDQANYRERFEKLKRGDYQLAVSTIDAYLLNASSLRFPGVIVSVLDESKGGDAILANKQKIKSLDSLKKASKVSIAFTPASPSEHLLKSVGAHFDIPMLKQKKGGWRVEANGSEDARKLLEKGKVDIAVVWEPDVSRLLAKKQYAKIMGTEDTQGLIVDVLLANRKFAQQNPEVLEILLKNYFRVLKRFRDNEELFTAAFSKQRKTKPELVKRMIKGVAFASLFDNARLWYGIANNLPSNQERLISAIEATVNILIEHGDFTDNPIQDENYYLLTNRDIVQSLYSRKLGVSGFGVKHGQLDDGRKSFSPLSVEQWSRLREIGTLKVRPIIFQSGSDVLTYTGKHELDLAAENLKHYPNYRLIIKGHTGTRGDSVANIQLSQSRSDSVKRYLEVTHGVDTNRMRPLGLGGAAPLRQKPGENYRAYQTRLSRVELYLVTEDI